VKEVTNAEAAEAVRREEAKETTLVRHELTTAHEALRTAPAFEESAHAEVGSLHSGVARVEEEQEALHGTVPCKSPLELVVRASLLSRKSLPS
jgi:hypothetical protein